MERYLGMSDTLDTAIRYLVSADLTKLAMGRNEVDGDNVFINRFDYTTMPEEQASWEGHKYYADIHVVLEGEERIGVTDAGSLTAGEYDAAGDFIPYEGPVDAWVAMRPGDILVVPYTTNDLLPYLRQAAAVICEEASADSHAATVGLILNKPVLVGAMGATRHLEDGVTVSVDCARGIVQTLPQ